MFMSCHVMSSGVYCGSRWELPSQLVRTVSWHGARVDVTVCACSRDDLWCACVCACGVMGGGLLVSVKFVVFSMYWTCWFWLVGFGLFSCIVLLWLSLPMLVAFFLLSSLLCFLSCRYLDNSPIGTTQTGTGAGITSTNPFRIGAGESGVPAFKGQLDEVSMWNIGRAGQQNTHNMKHTAPQTQHANLRPIVCLFSV